MLVAKRLSHFTFALIWQAGPSVPITIRSCLRLCCVEGVCSKAKLGKHVPVL